LDPAATPTCSGHTCEQEADRMPEPIRTILQSPEFEGLLRIILAGGLGALIGLQRELTGKPAGIRTYGLVAMGASMFTIVAVLAYGPGDPASRIVAQIITGIGFLGAGTIIHLRGQIVGLTTAAGLWISAAVGIAIGSGLYLIGIGGALLVLLLLVFLRPQYLVKLGITTQDEVDGKIDMDAVDPDD